jgi:hypothetical protein
MTAGTPQYTWLRDQLTGSTARWKIVVCHMPTWSCGPVPNVFSKQTVIHPYPIHYSGVRTVLSGSNHYYCRAMADGIAYITTGGAGVVLDAPSLPADSVVVAEAAHHFLRLEMAGDSLVGTAIRTDDSPIERFVLQLPPTGVAMHPTALARQGESAHSATCSDLAGRVAQRSGPDGVRVVAVRGATVLAAQGWPGGR